MNRQDIIAGDEHGLKLLFGKKLIGYRATGLAENSCDGITLIFEDGTELCVWGNGEQMSLDIYDYIKHKKKNTIKISW